MDCAKMVDLFESNQFRKVVTVEKYKNGGILFRIAATNPSKPVTVLMTTNCCLSVKKVMTNYDIKSALDTLVKCLNQLIPDANFKVKVLL